MTEASILGEIEIDLTSCRSESVPSNEPQLYSDNLEHVKRGGCTVNDLRGNGGTPRKLEEQKVWQYLQIALLSVVIVIVWGLLAIPIVIFYLPPKDLEVRLTRVVTDLNIMHACR